MPAPLNVPPPIEIDWQLGQARSVGFDRVRLDIPGRAFAERAALRIAVPDDPPAIPSRLKMPFVFRAEARSALTGASIHRLLQPIRFSIDFSDLSHFEWGQTYVNLYYFDEDSREWKLVPASTDMKNKRIEAEVDHFTDFGFGGDDATLPSTPSNLEGFSVDLCTGNVSASIPLKVPPGINGQTPSLELRYTSGILGQMNEHIITDGATFENKRTLLQASPVGFGWSLDLGAVFRSSKTDANGHPSFFLLLNGRTIELAYVDGTVYKTIPDEFLRVRKLGNSPNNQCSSHEYWLIETKDGKQYRYGYNADSEQRAGKWQFGTGGVQKAWQWSLDQISDTHGNTIAVTYVEDSAVPDPVFGDSNYYDQAAYPSVIKYGANPGQSFTSTREIHFIYSTRSDKAALDPTTNYTQFYWKKKLDRVEMYVGTTLARAYDLGHEYTGDWWLHPRWYDEAASGAQPPYSQTEGLTKLLLTSVTERAGDGVALPATTFIYSSDWVPPDYPARCTAVIEEICGGYGAKTTYHYEAHTPDGWWKLPRRFRVHDQSTNPGTGSQGGVSPIVTRTFAYGTSYNVADEFDYRGHDYVSVSDTAGHVEKSYFYARDAVNGKNKAEVKVCCRAGPTARCAGPPAPARPPTPPRRRPSGAFRW